ncbi:hypothetical protein C5167_035364 [Papaver somniferum]|uniref:LOB domain-containing protein n=1 Tax=Papaver somniferum TaxID=3469 RepID=A0A4Y7KJ29_PAPSO|nr:hypothetical protein C5167_035364 [Papaver somniferum]
MFLLEFLSIRASQVSSFAVDSTMASSSNSPCAACKFLRRKCTQECVFAPYFPPDQPQKFANVHKVFGASNVAKLLNEITPTQREDAVNSLAYEAEARLRDPVYGCVGVISTLQHRLKQVEHDLYNAKKELSTFIGPAALLPLAQHPHHPHHHPLLHHAQNPNSPVGVVAGGGGVHFKFNNNSNNNIFKKIIINLSNINNHHLNCKFNQKHHNNRGRGAMRVQVLVDHLHKILISLLPRSQSLTAPPWIGLGQHVKRGGTRSMLGVGNLRFVLKNTKKHGKKQ